MSCRTGCNEAPGRAWSGIWHLSPTCCALPLVIAYGVGVFAGIAEPCRSYSSCAILCDSQPPYVPDESGLPISPSPHEPPRAFASGRPA
jgi:hypothetical protein